MRGDQPVVSAASWIVNASISAQRTRTLTRPCQGLGPRGDVNYPGTAGSVRISAIRARSSLEAVVERPRDPLESIAIAEPALAIGPDGFDWHTLSPATQPRADRIDDDCHASASRPTAQPSAEGDPAPVPNAQRRRAEPDARPHTEPHIRGGCVPGVEGVCPIGDPRAARRADAHRTAEASASIGGDGSRALPRCPSGVELREHVEYRPSDRSACLVHKPAGDRGTLSNPIRRVTNRLPRAGSQARKRASGPALRPFGCDPFRVTTA